jgi:SAM-dependent methyltransferase
MPASGPHRAIEPWSKESAELYELIHDADSGHRDAERLRELLLEVAPAATTLLDVACGTGEHLERLRHWYTVEGLDASPAMLEVARERLPDVPLHEADMRFFELDRRFDVIICLSSNIAHMQTLTDLNRALACMARRLSDAGVLVIEPWDFAEEAQSDRPWVVTAETDDRAVALVETTTLRGGHWEQDSHFLLWRRDGPIAHLLERSTLGAFTKKDHTEALEAAGLSVRFDGKGLLGRGLFIAKRPSSQ